MSCSPDDAEFWLPPQILAEDDVVFVDKENFQFKNGATATSTALGASNMAFPTEFPYEFDSFGSNSALSSPVESVVSSTETDSSDEEDFFAGLTRRFAQSTLRDSQKLKPEWVLSGSPQSTLSGIGSWSFRSTISRNGSPNGPSQVASPPTTPFGAKNDTWDLIYAAAGQVARLKVNGEEHPKLSHHHGRGLLVPPARNPNNTGSCGAGFYSNQSLAQNLTQFQGVIPQQCGSAWGRQVKVGWSASAQQQQQQSHYQQQQIQNRGRNCGYENGRCGRPLNLPQSAWPPLQVQNQNQNQNQQHHPSRPAGMGGVFAGGSTVKKECAGTGVFLPRRYTNPPEPRKKSGCPNVLLPAKVVQALNLSFEDMNNGHSQPRFGCGFAPDHEALMARRNALLEQQRRSLRPEGALNHEVRLPQEWTY
ncbi:hypothetical protein L484_005867 [Morus notabilis]|uniref:TIP41-like protein n=1 Tax=Morus notabilis TaxID=981085 RepID=W9S3V8_9ROSA|nr:uncharacterized protein LOC21389320 [Morus notabilis]EXC07560.1 hypothetical protein L484_005867 [Morus notabilis]